MVVPQRRKEPAPGIKESNFQRAAARRGGRGATKTHALDSLVIAGFIRGLSTRDVQASPAESSGALMLPGVLSSRRSTEDSGGPLHVRSK